MKTESVTSGTTWMAPIGCEWSSVRLSCLCRGLLAGNESNVRSVAGMHNNKEILNRLRQFDAYPKTLEDFRVKTYGGALVTVISSLFMFVLFVSELNYYLTKEVHPELFVDISRGQKLRINVDITFSQLPCALVSTDAMDVSGEQQIDVDHNLYKRRLKLDGTPVDESVEEHKLGSSTTKNETKAEVLDPNRCESCYGAESDEHKCCSTCEDVREAYRKKGWAFSTPDEIAQCKREGWSRKIKEQQNEGCQLFGYLEVNKVAGNFHFAPGKSFQQHHSHVHDLQSFGSQKTPNQPDQAMDGSSVVNTTDFLSQWFVDNFWKLYYQFLLSQPGLVNPTW